MYAFKITHPLYVVLKHIQAIIFFNIKIYDTYYYRSIQAKKTGKFGVSCV